MVQNYNNFLMRLASSCGGVGTIFFAAGKENSVNKLENELKLEEYDDGCSPLFQCHPRGTWRTMRVWTVDSKLDSSLSGPNVYV